MTERLHGFQNVSSGTIQAALQNKTLCRAKTLGCCIVAVAAMVAASANATMTTKKDAGASAKAPPAAKEAPGTKKKDAVKSTEGAGAQESKLAPPAGGAKKPSPK